MCRHLQRTIDYLFDFHDLKIIETVRGKSWGVCYLIDGNIPFGEIIHEVQVDNNVTISKENGLICCKMCWENIAEYSRYYNKWQ